MTEEGGRRRYSRVRWGDRAVVAGRGEEAAGQVLDISLNGVLVAADAGLEAGDHCTVRIPLGGASEPGIEAEGCVVRRTGEDLAIRFETMELDSLVHLRQVVTLNSEDPGRAEREAVHLGMPEGTPPAADD